MNKKKLNNCCYFKNVENVLLVTVLKLPYLHTLPLKE